MVKHFYVSCVTGTTVHYNCVKGLGLYFQKTTTKVQTTMLEPNSNLSESLH